MIYFNITLEEIIHSMLRNNSCLINNFIGKQCLTYITRSFCTLTFLKDYRQWSSEQQTIDEYKGL